MTCHSCVRDGFWKSDRFKRCQQHASVHVSATKPLPHRIHKSGSLCCSANEQNINLKDLFGSYGNLQIVCWKGNNKELALSGFGLCKPFVRLMALFSQSCSEKGKVSPEKMSLFSLGKQSKMLPGCPDYPPGRKFFLGFKGSVHNCRS